MSVVVTSELWECIMNEGFTRGKKTLLNAAI